MNKKIRPKILIFSVILALAILIVSLIRVYLSSGQPESFIISDDQWVNIKTDISHSYTYRYLNRQLSKNSQIPANPHDSNAKKFFLSLNRYADIPQANQDANILGDQDDTRISSNRDLSSFIAKNST